MTIKQQLEKLATVKNIPCVTISLNTHRTHPDNAQDVIELKNLLNEAEERVIKEFGKKPVSSLLERLSEIENEIDVNYNLDSLHIYISNNTKEIIKSTWSTNENGVYISNTFNVRSLIKSYSRSEEYLILLLSQSGVKLYNALNDEILNEIRNEDFPFSENTHYNTHSDKGSDSKHLDDLVREFLNKVDKAVVKISKETELNCVVICSEDNYSRLLQVTDKSIIYHGHANIDYNKTDTNHIAKQGWEKVKILQHNRRTDAISEIKEAVGQGNVYTDLQEIYQAALDGRGDLLMMDEDFTQPVSMTSDRAFQLENDKTKPDVLDDITSNIAWEVFSKKGRVFFTKQEEVLDIGKIVLKMRY
ncbi:MAG: hypothetical protein ACJA1A_001457 [Saprospiraceae bacterium]|jgi:hypothetical protein|tara:strand:- start:1897 stop:2976 length:1080 start_codon:yes stop_codon:yes gene_type:complete